MSKVSAKKRRFVSDGESSSSSTSKRRRTGETDAPSGSGEPSPTVEQGPVEGDTRQVKGGGWRRFNGQKWYGVCEDCHSALPSYGVYRFRGGRMTPHRRWCKTCAVINHEDDYVDFHRKCEDCKSSAASYGTYHADGSPNRRWCKKCSTSLHQNEFIDFTKKCEDCQSSHPVYGTDPVSRARRWCRPCALADHQDEYLDFTTKCEDCHSACPAFGTWQADGVTPNRRWCKICSDKNHKAEYIDFTKKCEDCHSKRPVFGTLHNDGVTPNRRWCRGCADLKHAGEFLDFGRKCDDCNLTAASYGMWRDDGMPDRRWCKRCALERPDHVDFTKKCEDCQSNRPTFGTWHDDGVTPNRRWCRGCADSNHEGDYLDFHLKCEDCHLSAPNYGVWHKDGIRAHRLWCKRCADLFHEGEYVDFQTKRQCDYTDPSTGVRCSKHVVHDGRCTVHHPEYVPTRCGASKSGCAWIDGLESALGVPHGSIQHKHYDRVSKAVIGEEHKLRTVNKTSAGGSKPCGVHTYFVDGWLDLTKLTAPVADQVRQRVSSIQRSSDPQIRLRVCDISSVSAVLFEFYGHQFHGYPNDPESTAVSTITKRSFGAMYEKTMERLMLLADQNSTCSAVYIWESDFSNWKKQSVGQSVLGYCRLV